jgi:hypothetical protein
MNHDERFGFDGADDGDARDGGDDRALRAELRAALAVDGRTGDGANEVLATLRPRLVRARRRYLAVRAGVAATALACAAAIGLTVAGAATGGSHGQVRIVPPAGSDSTRTDGTGTVSGAGRTHRTGPHPATGTAGGGSGRAGGTASGPSRIVTAPHDASPPGGGVPSGTTPSDSTTPGNPSPSTTPTTAGNPTGSTTSTVAPTTTTTSTAPGMQTGTYAEPQHDAGSVTLSWDAHNIVVDAVDPQPGWTYSVHYDDPHEMHVTFHRATPLTSATMQFQIVGGALVVDD